MKTLVFYSSRPVYHWGLEEEVLDIREFTTLEDVLKLQEDNKGMSVIIKKPYGKFNDYCDMIIEIYDDYRE